MTRADLPIDPTDAYFTDCLSPREGVKRENRCHEDAGNGDEIEIRTLVGVKTKLVRSTTEDFTVHAGIQPGRQGANSPQRRRGLT
ncbi:hypothetical protein QLX08_000697 [Tetragonisca angustula]|uniref:Uncharacterized protein n=1 Tax=Tetragonisca angustula TaxID=166442 RepID=A0AAW1AIF3_9HYME